MTPVLIVPTANGYVFLEYSGEVPPADLSTMKVATQVDEGHSYYNKGHSLCELLKSHFEPPKAAPELKEAA